MNALEYLKTLEPNAIARAYRVANASYNGPGDEAAALLLQQQAALAGRAVRISGPTLGRYRSKIGLVLRKSTRGAGAPLEAKAPIQAELPAVAHDDGSERAGWATVHQLKEANALLREIKVLLAGMSGRVVIEAGKSSAPPQDRLSIGAAAVRAFGHNKIDGIKWIRNEIGPAAIGLKEAKDLYEECMLRPQSTEGISLGEPS